MNQDDLYFIERQTLQKTMLELADMGNHAGITNERKRIAELLRQNLSKHEADIILELLEIREKNE
jgi:hypothetical protein